MAAIKRPKLTAANAAGELQVIEQFGRRLGVNNIAALKILQTAVRHCVIIAPRRGRPGKAEARLQDQAEILLVSRQPLLDCARILLAIGCSPDSTIATRRPRSGEDDMRAVLSAAAKLTVDETNGTVFSNWKPWITSVARRSRLASRNRCPPRQR